MFLVALAVVPAILIAAAFFIFFLARSARRTKHTKPKGFSIPRSDKPLPKPRDSFRDCSRDPFREKKLPPDIDYVIIGSGIGSLYCAGLLARAGQRVVVLDQVRTGIN